MKKKWLLIVVLLVILSGCGDSNSENDNLVHESTGVEQNNPANTEKQGYVFVYDDVVIAVDAEAAPIIAALGEPNNYFEAPSCAFEGLDKTYSYEGFEVTTYEQDGKDYISGVFFWDDRVQTAEGISLFMSTADIITAYGNDYSEEYGRIVYKKDGMELRFMTGGSTGEEIVAIEYVSGFLDLQ